MAFLELKNIGKIYASEGAVAVGIRGVNASFERGEFVAVTGESGSGKSTLLNVISGMDTYEEGELFIEGQPTSHYLQPDWEEYRKKYISFIFQDYNIIESFTVLQNVELSLMHIKSAAERRRRAMELLDRVGMAGHAGHKGSKLSGGQKQRTVIARALAKDSPIILADEPTGNLDAASSREIMSLLSEISRDKLVIVVTHSFDESEMYATRHIRIYDGAVASDTELREHEVCRGEIPDVEKESAAGDVSNGFSLGWAIFRSKPLLSLFICVLLLIGTFAVLGLSSASASALELFKKQYVFKPIEGRTVVARRDGAPPSDAETSSLIDKNGAESCVRFDAIFDSPATITTENGFSDMLSSCRVLPAGTEVRPTVGRMPVEADEILVILPVSCAVESYSVSGFEPFAASVFGCEFRVVGLKTVRDNREDPCIVVSEKGFEYISACCCGELYMSLRASAPGKEETVAFTSVVPSGKLSGNEISVIGLPDDNKRDYEVTVSGSVSFGRNSGPEISETFVGNYREITPAFKQDYGGPVLCVSVERYVGFFKKLTGGEDGYPQISLMFGSKREAKKAASLATGDVYVAVSSDTERELTLLELVEAFLGCIFSAIMWVLGVVCISFFINLCTSRTIDAFRGEMAVMRSMGIPVRVIRLGMFFRMFISAVPAIVISAVTVAVIFGVPELSASLTYVSPATFLLVVAGMLIIVTRVTVKHVRRLFGESVKKAIRSGR